MKKKKITGRQLLSILCLAVFLLALSGCAQGKQDVNIENKDSLTSSAEEYFESWNSTDFNTAMEQYADYLDDDTKAIYQSWQDTKDEIGKYDSIIDRTYSKSEDNTIVTLRAKYEKEIVDFSITFNQAGEMADNPVVEIYTPMNKKLKKAGINTIMCIVIVFVVLIFISFIISLLKYVPKLFGLEKKEEQLEEKAAPVISAEKEEDYVNDTELVAVITAAIMAGMGSEAPEDGLVISSIKRRSTNKWRR